VGGAAHEGCRTKLLAHSLRGSVSLAESVKDSRVGGSKCGNPPVLCSSLSSPAKAASQAGSGTGVCLKGCLARSRWVATSIRARCPEFDIAGGSVKVANKSQQRRRHKSTTTPECNDWAQQSGL
jgi:hypothetical protein